MVDLTVGDGNGWVWCARGHRHWGRFGAAGLLVTDGSDVLLQHRAAWTHEGDSWALPGGARDSHEQPLAAALREAREETTLDTRLLTPLAEWTSDHGGWSYTTVIVRGPRSSPEPANAESDELRWFAPDRVAALPLHRGFAQAWPHLREALADAVPRADQPPPAGEVKKSAT